MSEQLRPHELAEQLRQSEFEIRDGRVESARLGSVLQRLGRVSLYGQKYEQDEHGHVTVDSLERGLARDEASYLIGAEVTFHDPVGNETKLGGIHYIDRERNIATATVQTTESKPEPLLPSDERWDAVVGTITRAVDQAWTEKFRRQY